MACRYQVVKDEAELLAMYRAGLLLLNRSDSKAGRFAAGRTPDEDSMVGRYRRACARESVWIPEDFAYLVDDDEDDN
jgi:hypothetical protein